MEENTVPTVQSEPIASGHSFFRRLVLGDLGLAHTFWLHAIAISSALYVLAMIVIASLNNASTILANFLGSAVLLSGLIYQTASLAGVWQAAGKYRGNRLWVHLTYLLVILGGIQILGLASTLLLAVLGLRGES
jgi:hypothetical protein